MGGASADTHPQPHRVQGEIEVQTHLLTSSSISWAFWVVLILSL